MYRLIFSYAKFNFLETEFQKFPGSVPNTPTFMF